jgi:hypothetical protein
MNDIFFLMSLGLNILLGLLFIVTLSAKNNLDAQVASLRNQLYFMQDQTRRENSGGCLVGIVAIGMFLLATLFIVVMSSI